MRSNKAVYLYTNRLVIWCLLSFPLCFTEKLSPDQRASLFACDSGGLILKPSFESEQKVASSPSVATNVVSEDDVEKKKTASFKLVDGELVRVVKRSFSYKSPEGIPVFVQYIADENGYRVGFRVGAAAIGETGPHIRLRGPEITSSKINVNQSYLPPQ